MDPLNLPPTAIRCFIGLGSNLNLPLSQLREAVQHLHKAKGFTLLRLSSIYSSAAIGPGEQPDYLNAVAELYCTLNADALLKTLQNIEQQRGRQRKVRWAARTLDLDILLFGSETINSKTLSVPHPEMCRRNFVIYPLYELEPGLILPDGHSLSSVYKQLTDEGLKRLYNVEIDQPA